MTGERGTDPPAPPPVTAVAAGAAGFDADTAAATAAALAEGAHVSLRLALSALERAAARRLDALAAAHPGRLTLWLEGPSWPDGDRALDLGALEWLGHLRWLRLEGGGPVADAAPLAALGALEGLTLGAGRLPRDLLSHLPAARLRWLALSEYDAKSVDLGPLAGFGALRALSLDPFAQGVEALGALGGLRALALTPARGADYAALDGLAALERLVLMQGAAASLERIALPALRSLTAIEVRGLAELGDLARLPALERLRLVDIPRVPALRIGGPLPALAHIALTRCTELGVIEGLAHLTGLRTLDVERCRLDPRGFELAELPPGVTHVRIWRFAGERQEAHDAAVRAAGYSTEPGFPPEPPFGGADRMPLSPLCPTGDRA